MTNQMVDENDDDEILINNRAFNKLKLKAVNKNSGSFGVETPVVDRRPNLKVLVDANGERTNNSSNNARGKIPNEKVHVADLIALNSSSDETFGYTPGVDNQQPI